MESSRRTFAEDTSSVQLMLLLRGLVGNVGRERCRLKNACKISADIAFGSNHEGVQCWTASLYGFRFSRLASDAASVLHGNSGAVQKQSSDIAVIYIAERWLAESRYDTAEKDVRSYSRHTRRCTET